MRRVPRVKSQRPLGVEHVLLVVLGAGGVFSGFEHAQRLAAGHFAFQREVAKRLVLLDFLGVQGKPVDEHFDRVLKLPRCGNGLGVIKELFGLLAVLFRNVAIAIGSCRQVIDDGHPNLE